MKLLIEVPTWLGDCVMATASIENIVKYYPDIEITIFGAYVSTEIFKKHPNVKKIIFDKGKTSKLRFLWLYKKARELDTFDIALSFRESFASKFFIYGLKAKKRGVYKRDKNIEYHQVERYNDFINHVFGMNNKANYLKIYIDPLQYKKPTLGINPGASYGSAKRWYPQKFSKVAKALSEKYNIIIFGGPAEVDMAYDIEKALKHFGVDNYINIAGKTTIVELCEKIGGLDLFITGDSGPMHVAAAYKVPTVAIFGPTKEKETNQWKNEKSIIVKKEMECAPCMKRVCPLQHHECMKLIEVEDVLNAVKKLGLT